jgi:hypothetical protein
MECMVSTFGNFEGFQRVGNDRSRLPQGSLKTKTTMLSKDINTEHDVLFDAEVIHNRYVIRTSSTWLQSSHRKDILLQVCEQKNVCKERKKLQARKSTGYRTYLACKYAEELRATSTIVCVHRAKHVT